MVPSICLTFALPVGSFFRVYLPFWLGLCIDVCLSLFTSNSAELDVLGCVFICVWISTQLIKRLRFAFMSYSVLILCFLAYVSVPLTQFSFVFFPFVWHAFNWNFINIDFWITYFEFVVCFSEQFNYEFFIISRLNDLKYYHNPKMINYNNRCRQETLRIYHASVAKNNIQK